VSGLVVPVRPIDTSLLIGDDYGKDHMLCWDFGIATVDLPWPTWRAVLIFRHSI
jgi:hypothetical protein